MPQKRRARRTKILANKHTGKIQHHKHTSYVSLLAILVLAASMVSFTERTVAADSLVLQGSGAVQAFAVVPAPEYKNAPTLNGVQNGQTFKTSDLVAVNGACPGTSLVEIYDNDIMAGAALCTAGAYHVRLGLYVGINTLVARAYNANNIASPDSSPITVKYAPDGLIVASGGTSFYISADQSYRAAKVGEPLTWQLTISGGEAPYAVSVDWGDGNTELYSKTAAGTYNLSHTYARATSPYDYTPVVRATDEKGLTAYLQLVAIVRGTTTVTTVTKSTTPGFGGVAMGQVAGVALGSAALTVAGFWLGEIRKTHQFHQGLVRA